MLSASAFGILGFGLSLVAAAIAVPTGKHSEIGPWVQPGLLAAAAVCTLLAVVLFIFLAIERRGREAERADILDEMEAEEEAWRS